MTRAAMIREEKTLENIQWLVPLAIGHLEKKDESFHVIHRKEETKAGTHTRH